MRQPDFSEFPILTTDRFTLRKLLLSDAPELYKLRSDMEVARLTGKKPFASVDQATAHIERINQMINNKECIFWGISYKESTELIGAICFWNFDVPNETVEIGYELLPEFQHKGIMAEVLEFIIGYGYEVMGVKTIVAFPSSENPASVKLLEKVGFKLASAHYKNPHTNIEGMLTYVMKRISLLLLIIFLSIVSYAQEFHRLKIKNTKQLKEFFRYKGESTPIISGHRGGMIKGFPENSIETFENTLLYTPAFYEIDPRLTKDGVAVIMHDATLERTTNGIGKVSDYTYAELQKLRLKDPEGHVTEAKIPTLKEAIHWSKGKTVLNLDKKDLPLETTAKILMESKNDIIMLTVHNAEQAKFYYNYNPKWMLSAFVKTKKAFQEYEAAGIPWSNMIAYIGPEITAENQELLNLLHAKGVMCMISAAPSYDKLNDASERAMSYRMVFEQGADILESDLPIEVAKAIMR